MIKHFILINPVTTLFIKTFHFQGKQDLVWGTEFWKKLISRWNLIIHSLFNPLLEIFPIFLLVQMDLVLWLEYVITLNKYTTPILS